MKAVSLVLVLLLCSSAFAQQPASTADWGRVQALPSGTRIHVSTHGASTMCLVKTVSADSLTCANDVAFQRPDIRKISLPSRVKSGVILAAAIAGAGMIFGASISGKNSFIPRGKAVAAGGAGGAIIGFPLGFATDFAHTTIYRAR